MCCIGESNDLRFQSCHVLVQLNSSLPSRQCLTESQYRSSSIQYPLSSPHWNSEQYDSEIKCILLMMPSCIPYILMERLDVSSYQNICIKSEAHTTNSELSKWDEIISFKLNFSLNHVITRQLVVTWSILITNIFPLSMAIFILAYHFIGWKNTPLTLLKSGENNPKTVSCCSCLVQS